MVDGPLIYTFYGLKGSCHSYLNNRFFLFSHVGMCWWVNMVEFSVLIGPVLVGLFLLNDPTSLGHVLVLFHVHLTGTPLHDRNSLVIHVYHFHDVV